MIQDLHFPWLEACILTPLIGSLILSRMNDRYEARRWCVYLTGLTFVLAFGAWQDFYLLGAKHAGDFYHLSSRVLGYEIFTIDQFSAPLLPLVSLMYFLTSLTTVKTKVRRFSFASTLISQAITLATFSCELPWLIILLLAAGAAPPYFEMKSRGKPTRVYLIHQSAAIFCMVLGQALVTWEGQAAVHSIWAVFPLLIAVLIRCGMAPFHCWLTDLFEHSTFGTALLFATCSTGPYMAFRLVMPIAVDWVMTCMALVSVVTAVYASGMSLVQKESRRFFCYLFLSHSALILVGMESLHHNGLTGALCVWISVVLSLGGFGLVLRAVESRRGRVQLAEYQGLYDHMPTLAVCFILTGLASVGFPGTIGFIGTELIVDCVVEEYPFFGAAVVIAAALNGIAVVHAYLMIFTGTRHASSVSLKIGVRERFAMLTLSALIILGGLFPQPGVVSRYGAAKELRKEHEIRTGSDDDDDDDDDDHDDDDDGDDEELDVKQQKASSKQIAGQARPASPSSQARPKASAAKQPSVAEHDD